MKGRTLKRFARVSAGPFIAALACATVATGALDAGAARIPPAPHGFRRQCQ